MRFSTKVTSLVAAGGVAALGLGLLAFAPGVGAAFTDSSQAVANINVGTFGCTITSSASGATVSDNGHTVTVPLGTIQSSAAGQKTAGITVQNAGSMPLYVSWDVDATGHFFDTWQHTYLPVPQNQTIPASGTRNYMIGATWSELTNADLGTTGTVTYTAQCSDQPAAMSYSTSGGASYSWNNSHSELTFTIPSGAPSGAGASVDLLNAGSALPTTQPKFVSSFYAAGTPRLSILLSDGTRIIVNGDDTVNLPTDTSNHTWADAQSYASGKTVTDVMVVADTSAGLPFSSTISCINYSGTPLFGTC